ncbi:MAG: hypothetical protein FWF85_02395 [Clostridiales bacterium]|nr:hypothetical protein [Clostridiales bacterium]
MQEFLTTLLEAVIAVVVPIITAFVVQFLKAKANEARVNLDCELAERYISEVEDAVTTAVLHTSQSYVDALRDNGGWNKESQQEALRKARTEAMSLLSTKALAFLTMAHADLSEYLTCKIEAEIKLQKSKEGD